MPAPSGSSLILFTRHGLSEHNLRTDVFTGRSPASRLVAQGRTQAQRLGDALAREGVPQAIVCSSLPRAAETAALIAGRIAVRTGSQGAGAQNTVPVHPDDAFWELSKGEWEGRMPRPLPPEWQRQVDADPLGFTYPGGESYRQVLARVVPAFEGWMRKLAPASVLFVLHGDVLSALFFHLLRFPESAIGDYAVAPCSLTAFERSSSGTALLRFNDTRAQE